MKFTLLLILIVIVFCPEPVLRGQEIYSPVIKGIRVNGSWKANLPVITKSSSPFLLEIDYASASPENIHIRFLHCSRDWTPTPSLVLNDDNFNVTRVMFDYTMSPAGIDSYKFTYRISIPNADHACAFEYSGNYIGQILTEDEKGILAQFRFFVTEESISGAITVDNRNLPSAGYPQRMVHLIKTRISLPQEQGELFFPSQVACVDIYRNREFDSPRRIDVNDRDPSTFVEDFNLTTMTFRVDNVIPGNSYRTLDLNNTEHYPYGAAFRKYEGADVVSFPYEERKDHRGTSTVRQSDRFSDYIDFRFELLSDRQFGDTIFVLGDFNYWHRSPEAALSYDYSTQRYEGTKNFRRGRYDYRYVLGSSDDVTLEGNSWRTINVYSAFVYYHDFRYGGFDRLLKVLQLENAPTMEPTSN